MTDQTPKRDWAAYPYQPLPQEGSIRLLRITPRDPSQPKSSPIHCNIRTVPLRYEALAKGEPQQPPLRPTVRFDEYVTHRKQHEEIFHILDDQRIKQKRGLMGRAVDRMKRRSTAQRRNRVIDQLEEVPGRNMVLNQLPLIRHEEIGDNMQIRLGVDDESGNRSSDFRVIPDELKRDVVDAPLDEPQFRHRFTWPKVDRNDKLTGNYVAMSYSWGDENDRVPIYIDDHCAEVTRNLEEGLREFREMDLFKQGLWIWIDAVCINQKDIKEKTEQLKLMASIYQSAGNIIVWLGAADDTSDECIDYLHVTSINYRTEYVEGMDQTDLLAAHAHRNHAQMSLKQKMTVWSDVIRSMAPMMMENPEVHEEMIQLYNFFDRPYWRRLWIIQELAMGRAGMPIVCGSTVTQWRYVRDGILMVSSALDIFHEIIPRAFRDIDPDKKLDPSLLHVATIAQIECLGHRQELPPLPAGHFPLPITFQKGRTIFGPLRGNVFHTALRLIRDSHCKVGLDRVYGMLALPGLPDFAIEADYEKSAGEVYIEFIKQLVLWGESPAVFQFLDGTGASILDDFKLPLWCPNLGAKPGRRIGIIEGKWHADDPTAEAAPFSWGRQIFMPEFRMEDGREHLFCRGFITDAIDGLGAISMADREFMRFGSEFIGGVRQPKFETLWPYEDVPEDIVWWTLVGGARVGGEKAPSSFQNLLTAIPSAEPPKNSPDHRLWDFVNQSKDLPIGGRPLGSYFSPPGANGTNNFATAPARQAMAARTACRRLATTPKGRVALVPASTQPGDAIIILLGHGNPVVATLILTERGTGVFKIKGDAFVHGVMEGEATRQEIMMTGRDYFEEFYFI